MTEPIRPADGTVQTARARRRGQTAIALTVALLGFLLATQLRAQEGLTQRLQIERESDLGQILTQLQQRSDELQDEIFDLRVRVQRASSSATKERALLDDAKKRLESLRIALGVVPVTGPGIVMTIGDPDRTVGADVLLDAVQELRDAGAESIEIGTVRVVARTAFAGRAGALSVGGRTLSAPYVIRAIGSPATLDEGMRIPGGVVDSLGTRTGATVRIDRRATLRITSTDPVPRLRYAGPHSRR